MSSLQASKLPQHFAVSAVVEHVDELRALAHILEAKAKTYVSSLYVLNAYPYRLIPHVLAVIDIVDFSLTQWWPTFPTTFCAGCLFSSSTKTSN